MTAITKKRGRKPKSNFYHLRWNKVGLNEERAAEVLGVSVEEIKRYDKDGAPAMAEKLIALWDHKHIGYDEWSGFLFSRGVLRHKNKRWTPEMLHEYHLRESRMSQMDSELRRIKTLHGALDNLCTVFVDKFKMNRRKATRLLR